MRPAPTLVNFKCLNCGGLLIPRKGGRAECPYCGSKYYLSDFLVPSNPETTNYYDLDYDPQAPQIAAHAYAHFARLLDANPENSRAWFGKGIAYLAMMTGPYLDSREAISCFDAALECAAPEAEDDFKVEISKWINYLAAAICEWYSRREWLTTRAFRHIYELVVYSDNLVNLDPPTMEYWIWWMDMIPLADSAHTMSLFVGRLRRVDPDYLTPAQARTQTTFLAFAVFAGLLAAFMLLIILRA